MIVPAGKQALWSFAEILRINCAAELDVNPEELQAGLQPKLIGGTLSQSIFISDSLENGAGYSTRLSNPEIMLEILRKINDKERVQLENGVHADKCDSSCPNCLRSYDNRRLHSLLDWRLALDVAEWAFDLSCDTSRWLSTGQAEAESLHKTLCSAGVSTKVFQAEDLWGVASENDNRAIIFSHPLWMIHEDDWTNQQRNGKSEAELSLGENYEIEFFDLYTQKRQPQYSFVWLAQGLDSRPNR